jgi:hypothetical protein
MIRESEMPLGPKGTLHRDQDILDYWIVDEKSKVEIADLVGLKVKDIDKIFKQYRDTGVRVPSRQFASGKAGRWGGPTPKRIVLTDEDVKKVIELRG